MRTETKFGLLLLVSCFALTGVIAQAQTIKESTRTIPVVKATPTPSPTPAKWRLELNSKYQSSLHTSTDASKNSSITSSLGVNYFATPKLRILTQLGFAQAIQPSADFRVYNPEMRAFFALSEAQDQLKFSAGPTVTLPFGTDASEESLTFGLGAGGRMLLNLIDKDGVGFRGYYDLTFGRNFHRFETSIFANVNTQYSLNNTVYLEYNFTPVWNLNTTFGFTSNWSYQGLLSNNYFIEQELDFSATDWLTLYLSHVRGGDFLSANGQNYSFGLFSKDESRVCLGVVLSY